MSDPVVDTQFTTGTVITADWLNGVNDFVVTDGATKVYADAAVAAFADNLVNTSDYAKGAALVGFDGILLSAFLKDRNQRVVTSIASLKTLDKTKYTQAFVTGYYAQGDRGGGAYWMDSTDTISADNGGTIIVGSDGGRWKLIFTDLVSIRQFGAKGDGTTDDGAIFNTAILAVPRGTRIFIPRGQYRTSVTISVNGGVSLEGESRDTDVASGGCAIVGDALVTPIMKTVGVATTACPSLKNFTITRAGGTPATTLVGLETTATDQQVVEDVSIFNQGIGLYVHGQLSPYFHRVNTWKCSGYHVKIEATVEPTFLCCRLGRNGGVDVASTGYVQIVGTGVDTVTFERTQMNQSGALTGVIIQFTNYVNANGIINLIGCHIEGWSGGGFAADVGSTRVQRMKLVGTTAHQAGSNLQLFVATAGIFDDLIISGCSFDASVTLDGLDAVNVTGSNFTGTSFLVNGGTGAIVGNTFRLPVTATGTFSHFAFAANSMVAGFDFSGAAGTFNSTGANI